MTRLFALLVVAMLFVVANGTAGDDAEKHKVPKTTAKKNPEVPFPFALFGPTPPPAIKVPPFNPAFLTPPDWAASLRRAAGESAKKAKAFADNTAIDARIREVQAEIVTGCASAEQQVLSALLVELQTTRRENADLARKFASIALTLEIDALRQERIERECEAMIDLHQIQDRFGHK